MEYPSKLDEGNKTPLILFILISKFITSPLKMTFGDRKRLTEQISETLLNLNKEDPSIDKKVSPKTVMNYFIYLRDKNRILSRNDLNDEFYFDLKEFLIFLVNRYENPLTINEKLSIFLDIYKNEEKILKDRIKDNSKEFLIICKRIYQDQTGFFREGFHYLIIQLFQLFPSYVELVRKSNLITTITVNCFMPAIKNMLSEIGIKGYDINEELFNGKIKFELDNMGDFPSLMNIWSMRTFLENFTMIKESNNNPGVQLKVLSVNFGDSKAINWLIGMIPITIAGTPDKDFIFRMNRIIDVVMKSVLQKLINIPLTEKWEGDVHIVLPEKSVKNLK